MRALVRWVEENPGAAVPAIFFVVVIFGPAVEELVFRGAVFNGLYRLGLYLSTSLGGPEPSPRTARRASFILAALASSALFSLLHLEPVLLPALFILAVVLCALFERTGSLLLPFVAHAMFNSFATSSSSSTVSASSRYRFSSTLPGFAWQLVSTPPFGRLVSTLALTGFAFSTLGLRPRLQQFGLLSSA